MAKVKMFTSAYCPYCSRAKSLLERRGVVDLEEIHVDGQPGLRSEMTQLTGRTSVPQIFIGETYVGGCDDLHALDGRGGLVALLQS
jgi:glutaredoxin 3